MERNNIFIDDTRFIFKTNLSGDPARDTYGSSTRYANVVIPNKEQADKMAEMGLNVKCTKPKPGEEEGFEPTYFIKAILKYHDPDTYVDEEEREKKEPKVFLITGKNKPRLLKAETVGQIDDVYVVNVNCVLNPYFNKRVNRWSVYISKLYVEQDVDEDPYAARYNRGNDEESLPFD